VNEPPFSTGGFVCGHHVASCYIQRMTDINFIPQTDLVVTALLPRGIAAVLRHRENHLYAACIIHPDSRTVSAKNWKTSRVALRQNLLTADVAGLDDILLWGSREETMSRYTELLGSRPAPHLVSSPHGVLSE
jgi:hypothetical protein